MFHSMYIHMCTHTILMFNLLFLLILFMFSYSLVVPMQLVLGVREGAEVFVCVSGVVTQFSVSKYMLFTL